MSRKIVLSAPLVDPCGVRRTGWLVALLLVAAWAAPSARPVAGASFRMFRSAFVVVAPAGTSAADVAQALAEAEDLRAVFPAHWKAATAGLSSMDIPPVETLADDGTLYPVAGALDGRRAKDLFFGTHADEFEFVTFFSIQSACCSAHWTMQQDQTAQGYNYGPGAPPLYAGSGSTSTPPGLLGVNVVVFWPDGYPRVPGRLVPVLLHEFHHQWCCTIQTPDGHDVIETGGLAIGHWRARLGVWNRPKYPMGQSNTADGGWVDNGDGTYTMPCDAPDAVEPGLYAFPPFALYLMGLLSADEVDGLPIIRTSSPVAPCVTVYGSRHVIPIADIIRVNGYAARVPLPRGTFSPLAGEHAAAWAQTADTTIRVGETKWLWVALRNTGDALLGASRLSLQVVPGSSFTSGLEGVGWIDGATPASIQQGYVLPGEVTSIGFRARGVVPGEYKLALTGRHFDGSPYEPELFYILRLTVTP